MKCAHREEPAKSYTSAMYDAKRRKAKGERQWFCSVCKRWIWETYYRKEKKQKPTH
jgi:hypothetical protein